MDARRGLIGGVLVAGIGLLASACGGGQSANEPSGPVVADVAQATCTGPVRDGIALDPTAVACADNGFQPADDEFTFPNWGGAGQVDAASLVALFGPDAVCADQTASSCTLFPAARDWLAQINDAMAGGRCEGMAVLSARLDAGTDAASTLQSGAQDASDLTQDTPPVTRTIEYWWTTQFLPEVADPTAQVRSQQPADLVAALIQGLQEGKGYTLGMYFNGSGHAVTPFAVSQVGDTYDIAIYDNNFPSTIGHVLVDAATQTWTYDQATVNPGVQQQAWTGTGPGSLDLTAMQWRNGPFTAPFADTSAGDTAKDGERTILVTGRGAATEDNDSVGALVTVGNATFDTLDAKASLPNGISITQVRGRSTIVGVQIKATAEAGTVSVQPRIVRTAPSAPTGREAVAGTAWVSVDAVGAPRVTARAKLSTNAGFTATADSSGAAAVRTDPGTKAQVSVANGRRSFSLRMRGDELLDVQPAENGDADISLVDEAGDELSYVLDDETDGGVLDEVADVVDGEFSIEESEAEAEALDSQDSLDGGDDPTADQSGQDSGQDGQDATDSGSGGNGSGDNGSGDQADPGGDQGSDPGNDQAGNDQPADAPIDDQPQDSSDNAGDTGGDSGGAPVEDPGAGADTGGGGNEG